ncbi:unnamed protein product [Rotaria sp. Silwood1]|nr:unnamed protein product [Rotaria sp. Silwood1]
MIQNKLLQEPDFLIPYPIRFWVYLFSLIPSLACSIFVLYHLLIDKVLHNALNNHVIIVLLLNNLVYQLIDIPLSLSFYHLGNVWPASPILCLFWMFIDETLFSLSLILVGGASIQRHILIFHKQWLSTNKKRIFIHYLPIGVLCFYCIVFHFITILFPPCQNRFNYNMSVCGYPLCYYDIRPMLVWDIAINKMLPTLTIVVFSIALLVRVLLQRRRIHQHIQWRKHKKMTIQLLAIVMLYFFLYIPFMIIELIQSCCIPVNFGVNYEVFGEFFSYYVMFLFPFVNVLSLPNYKGKIKDAFSFCHRQIRTIISVLLPLKYFDALKSNAVAPLPQP